MPPFLPANKLQFYCWKSRQILQQQNNFKRDGFEHLKIIILHIIVEKLPLFNLNFILNFLVLLNSYSNI